MRIVFWYCKRSCDGVMRKEYKDGMTGANKMREEEWEKR